jgi:hypothetical protein
MADVLPNYGWERNTARYRDLSTGRFVSRNAISELLEASVSSVERRLGNLVTAAHEGRIAPAWFAETMRTELRRLSLQNASLGIGGIDRMDQRQYGRVGNSLRDSYGRVARLAADMQNGTVTLPQAMNRVQGYINSARMQYMASQRDALRATGRRMEARRRLSPAEHCATCIEYASRGWRPMEEVHLPGDGSTECGGYDKCTIEYREVHQPDLVTR